MFKRRLMLIKLIFFISSLYSSGIEIKSEAIYPFVSLAWIGSGLGDAASNVDYFEYRVILSLFFTPYLFRRQYKTKNHNLSY